MRDEARRRGVALTVMGDYQLALRGGPPTLLLGYARSSEATIRAGLRELAAAVRSTRERPRPRPRGH